MSLEYEVREGDTVGYSNELVVDAGAHSKRRCDGSRVEIDGRELVTLYYRAQVTEEKTHADDLAGYYPIWVEVVFGASHFSPIHLSIE